MTFENEMNILKMRFSLMPYLQIKFKKRGKKKS